MTKIKICGITRSEDAKFAAENGADFLGFVFADSPRRITFKPAAEIIAGLPKSVATVGLFVDEDESKVRQALKQARLDMLQFHGSESPEYCETFKGRAKIIKAIRVSDEKDLEKMADYDVDFFLLDAYVEGKPGGTGRSFNRELALKAKGFGKPIILAGGLNAENVGRAIAKVRPYGVDVSSGVESRPGVKDQKLIKSFIENARKKDAAG